MVKKNKGFEAESNGNKRKSTNDEALPASRRLRSREVDIIEFDYENKCLICAK